MVRTHIDKRSRLLSAAMGLAYQNGFGATSLADIAREAEVPLGNVYYYFNVIAHPWRPADQAGAARAVRMAVSGLRPFRRPVATMEQRSA